MARLARFVPITLLTLILVQPVPGAAFHDDGTPLLDSGSMSGPAWVIHRFSTNGEKVVADIEAHGVKYPMQAAAYIYDANDHLWGWFTFTVPSTNQGVSASANAAGQNVHAGHSFADGGQFLKAGLTLNEPGSSGRLAVGEFSLLMFIAGSASRTDYSFRGGPGVSHLRKSTGSDTFLYTSQNFAGLANTQAGTGGVGGRATVAAQKEIWADNTLIGEYTEIFGSVDSMSVDTPSGSKTCPCFFQSFVPDSRGTPFGRGSYVFKLTGAGSGGDGHGEVLLAGADATLP